MVGVFRAQRTCLVAENVSPGREAYSVPPNLLARFDVERRKGRNGRKTPHPKPEINF